MEKTNKISIIIIIFAIIVSLINFYITSKQFDRPEKTYTVDIKTNKLYEDSTYTFPVATYNTTDYLVFNGKRQSLLMISVDGEISYPPHELLKEYCEVIK